MEKVEELQIEKKTLILLNLIFIGFILFTFKFDLIRSYVKDGYVHFENTYFYMTTIVIYICCLFCPLIKMVKRK